MRSNLLYTSSHLAFSKGPKQPPPPTRVSDNLRSQDTVEVLLGLGEGPWSKLHDGLKSFYIANTPLMASDGTLNFPDAQLIFHKGTEMPDPVRFLLGGSAAGTGVGVNLAQNAPVTRTTTSGEIDAIDVRLRIDQLMKNTEEGDQLNEDLLFRIEVKPTSSGTWQSLPPNTGWLQNWTAPDPSDNNRRFFGTVIARIEQLQIDEQMSEYDAQVQAWQEYQDNVDGPIDTSLGVTAYAQNIRIYGRTQSPVMKEIRIPVQRLTTDTYDIRVTKISAESTSTSIREITWDTLEEITIGDKAYPNTAMAQLIVQASDQLSNVPAMYGIYDTTEVLVPTIFDPETRSYDFSGGPWDGTFKKVFTDDLAWIIYDLIHNDEHGIATYHPIGFSKYEALEASIYWNACDPVTGAYVGVPRPNGGTRPRVTFNGLIDQPRNSMELLLYMAGAGNAVFYEDVEGNFRLKVEQDTPATQTFNNMDVENGIFQYSFTDINTRYNDITVVYRNKKLPAYQEDRRRVFSQSDIDTHGRKPITFVAVGCVDTDEAISRAYHKMLTSLTETRQVSFTTTRFGAYVEPHDIILIADEAMDEGYSRRCVGLNPDRRTVTLNEALALESGVTDYVLRLQTTDGIWETQVLENDVDTTPTTLRIADAIPAGLDDNFSFSIASATEGDLRPYRVISIEEGDDGDEKIKISAIEVNRAKYGLIDNFDGTSFDVTDEPDISSPESKLVLDLQAVIKERATVNGKVKDINVTWDAPATTSAGAIYSVKYSYNDEVTKEVYRGSNLQFIQQAVPIGTHTFTVSTVNLDGTDSPQTRRVRVTTLPPDYGLPSITGVTIQNKKDSGATYIGKNVSIEWSVDTSEKWEGWASDKPHPDFAYWEINVVDNSNGFVVHTYELTDWKVKQFTIPYSEFSSFGLTDIRNFSVVVSASDSDGNEGASFSRSIQKPAITLQNVLFEQPDDYSGRGRMRFDIPDDPDFRGVKVWVSDTQDAHLVASNLVWNDSGTPVMDFKNGTNYISYQPIDIFGTVGQTIITTTFNASLRDVPAFITETQANITALGASASQAAADILALEDAYGPTVSAQGSAMAAQAAQTATESALLGATGARTAAEAAQALSEQAQRLAEDAQSASEYARLASETARGAAEVAETNAARSVIDANGAASDAAAAATVATQAKNDAQGYASSLASAASSATTKASEAEISASAAQASSVQASASLGDARRAADDALRAAGQTLPSTFENADDYFVHNLSGEPEVNPAVTTSPQISTINDATEGTGLRVEGSGDSITSRYALPATAGNTYRVTVRGREVNTPVNDRSTIGLALFRKDWTYYSIDFTQPSWTSSVDDYTHEFTVTQAQIDVGVGWIKPIITFNNQPSGSNDGIWEYFLLRIEDITAQKAAEASASSASAANASENAAGQAASAAQASGAAASTSASNASTSAGQAAQAASNAAGSAAAAALSEGIVVSTRGSIENIYIQTGPTDFENNGIGFSSSTIGNPTTAPDIFNHAEISPVTIGGRTVAQITNYNWVRQKAVIPVNSSGFRVWKFWIDIDHIDNSERVYFIIYGYDNDYNRVSGAEYVRRIPDAHSGRKVVNFYVTNNPAWETDVHALNISEGGGGINTPYHPSMPNWQWFSFTALVNYDNREVGSRSNVYGAGVDDYTAEFAARQGLGYASAAATSASDASAVQTAVGDFAFSASEAANTASTKAGEASFSATQAATSATNAGNSASAAQSALSVTASVSAAGNILTNGTFLKWNDGAERPVGWGSYRPSQAAGTSSQETTISPNGAPCLRQTTNAVDFYGAVAYSYSEQNGGGTSPYGSEYGVRPNLDFVRYWVVEADVYLHSGSWNGSGIFFNARNSGSSYATRHVDFSTKNLPTGKWVTVREFVDFGTNVAPIDDAIVYLMSNYDSYGGYATKDIIWSNVVVRPATETEIQLKEVQNIAGNVTTLSSVLAELQGRVTAHWAVETGVSGFTGTFISARTTNNQGVVSSDVSFGAMEIGLYNNVGGEWLRAMRVSGGDVRITGNLEAGAGIYLGTGSGRWPVALQDRIYNEQDGTVITFGTGVDIGEYDVDFSTIGLDTLGAGESYRLRPINKTGTGFTAELKITTTGSTTAVSETTNATSPTGPTHMVAKANTSAAYNDVYSFFLSGTVDIHAYTENEKFGGGGGSQTIYFGSVNVQTWFHDGSAWVEGPEKILDYAQLGINPTHSYGSQSYSFSNKSVGVNYTGTIRTSSTLGCFGATAGLGGTLTDLNKVNYTTQGQSGTRSATPSGELCKITVKPRNQSNG